jgi:allene oxide cyclase
MRRIVAPLSVSVAIVFLFATGIDLMGWPAPLVEAQTQLVVIEHAENETVVDLAAEGDSVGDTLVFSNELYDDRNSSLIGRSEGSCVRTVVGQSWECTFTISMEQGSLVVVGPFYDDGKGSFAIVGGTGEYADATGQMSLEASATSTTEHPEWEFTFDIR